MAYAAVASLLNTIDLLLNHHQLAISPQFKNQIISIHKQTSFLQSFLEGSSERVNNWEETIREIIDKAGDIIELLLSDSLLESSVGSSRSEFEKGKYEAVYGFNELERVTEEIESITNKIKGKRSIRTAVCSEDELTEIVSLLLGGSPSSLERIGICGSGGTGKSTLASNACHHPLIVESFDVRPWCTVTREYIRMRTVEDLLLAMKVENYTSNSEDELIERISQVLGRRRYLIVLDDVWSQEALDEIGFMLPDNGNGSQIIFTTRSFELAKSANRFHEMRLLDEDQTWNMLREKIFMGDPCPFQLESMGKTIARSCGGHPLSIVVVSGILASDKTEAAWEDVSENMKMVSEDGDKVYEILYLSYMYLPHHLKPCLLYLGIFPYGHPIYVSGLIRLWAAEGFMNESGYKSLEEMGEDYVKDLFWRSLVSIYNFKSNGRIKIITVHDLIKDFCRRQARIDNFNLVLEGVDHHSSGLEVKEIIKSCRRVSNLNYCDDFLSGVYGSTIRTLFFYSESSKLDLRCWMGNVRLLRILSLSNVRTYHLSGEVFELLHLRFLAFDRDLNIPEVISNLENLQTLIIRHAKKGGIFDKLPEGIWRMLQLRHLCIFSFKFPNKKGPTSDALQNLQTLSNVVDFVCRREILKMIPNVKKLALLYTNKLRDVFEDYELRNLAYLQKLEILKIEMEWSFVEQHKMSCAFPPTLKKLNLCGLKLPWEDMKIVSSLPNLEVLKLRNHACVGERWETSEEGFSRLTFLRIEESNLKNWITKSNHFPRLRWLVLVRCSSLLEVPYEMAEIPTLQIIDLDDKNHSLLRSAERIQQDRHSLGHHPILLRV